MPSPYSIPISATNAYGTGNGTLGITVNPPVIPATVGISFNTPLSNWFAVSGGPLLRSLEIATDGGALQSVVADQVYTANSQITYIIQFNPGVYGPSGSTFRILYSLAVTGTPHVTGGGITGFGDIVADAFPVPPNTMTLLVGPDGSIGAGSPGTIGNGAFVVSGSLNLGTPIVSSPGGTGGEISFSGQPGLINLTFIGITKIQVTINFA